MKKKISIGSGLIAIILIAFFLGKSVIGERKNEFYDPNTGNVLGNYLDKKTEKFLIGKWNVQELIEFTPTHKVDETVNYPYGQDIIGNEIIFNKNYYSTEGLHKYSDYQYKIDNPIYYIGDIYSREDHSITLFTKGYPNDSHIKEQFIITEDDIVKILKITAISNEGDRLEPPFTYYIVNNERLIVNIDTALFELRKVK